MMSAQYQINRRRMRSEARWRTALILGNAAIFAALAVIAVGIGHTILTAALNLPDLIPQAAALKGM